MNKYLKVTLYLMPIILLLVVMIIYVVIFFNGCGFNKFCRIGEEAKILCEEKGYSYSGHASTGDVVCVDDDFVYHDYCVKIGWSACGTIHYEDVL